MVAGIIPKLIVSLPGTAAAAAERNFLLNDVQAFISQKGHASIGSKCVNQAVLPC